LDCCVILSVYKGSKLKYVKEALESIYNQTLKPDIFIKIDGEIKNDLKEFLFNEKEKGNIKYLDYRKKNLGIAPSYNELIQEVLNRGYKYIVRMDSDDIMMSYRIEHQYNFMQSNPNIDVVGGYIEEFGNDFKYNKIVKYPLSHQEMFKFFSKRVPIANVTSFFRRTFFEKAGLYPTDSPTNEDTLLWMKGFENGCKFANIPEVLVKVRVSKDFFYRRTGIKKAFSDFKDRIKVIKTLNYGTVSYFYAIGMFIVNILPPSLKKLVYKILR
jgi:GT2 family glycosyltransferase